MKKIFTDTQDNEKSNKMIAVEENSILNLKIRAKYLTF